MSEQTDAEYLRALAKALAEVSPRRLRDIADELEDLAARVAEKDQEEPS